MENQLAIFETQDGKISLSVQFDHETVWLTQEQIAQLFERDRTVVTKHINNVFKVSLSLPVMCKNCTLLVTISRLNSIVLM